MTGPTPPDIVMLEYAHLPELINENLLLSLDEMIMKEKDFNVENIVPTIIDGLRKPGNGTLYALAPMFYSSAVIYNKQHFLNKGVEFPTDNMTWQEMFDLARRVTVDDDQYPVYGFSFTNYEGGMWNLYYNMNAYVLPLGLSWIDVDTLQMTANTPKWQEVWTTFTDLYKEKVFPQEPDYSQPRTGPFDWDLFLSGKAAMTVVPYSYLHQVVEANNQADRIENYEAIDWDVVTMPTHPEAPGVGSNVYYQGIFAINANAENIDDAWAFIKFIMGEDYARIKSKSTYNLVARQDYIKPIDGVDYNHDAFLKLSPPDYSDWELELYQKLPDYWSIQSIGQQKMMDVVNNGKDVGLALQEWEAEGQMMIEQLLEQQANGGGDDGGDFIIQPLPADISTGEIAG
jgi:multiple sugar transport system substrate-binding protein